MSKAWSHLPNAHHIDWVLASLKETPELWNAARAATRDAAWAAATHSSWYAVRGAVRGAAWGAAWSAVSDSTRDTAMSATWSVARAAISALVAYDDCDQFLSMSYERLKVWAVLSEDPRAVLLLPMIYVKEELAKLNLQPA